MSATICNVPCILTRYISDAVSWEWNLILCMCLKFHKTSQWPYICSLNTIFVTRKLLQWIVSDMSVFRKVHTHSPEMLAGREISLQCWQWLMCNSMSLWSFITTTPLTLCELSRNCSWIRLLLSFPADVLISNGVELWCAILWFLLTVIQSAKDSQSMIFYNQPSDQSQLPNW